MYKITNNGKKNYPHRSHQYFGCDNYFQTRLKIVKRKLTQAFNSDQISLAVI